LEALKHGHGWRQCKERTRRTGRKSDGETETEEKKGSCKEETNGEEKETLILKLDRGDGYMRRAKRKLRVFLSYAHADEHLQKALANHLSTMRRSGLIDVWHDREIPAGEEFDPIIADELDRADLILLLISASFLASDYCSSIELIAAMKRHQEGSARVLPIILRPCDWQTSPVGKLLVAPTDGKPVTSWRSRDEAFSDVVEKIRRIANEFATPDARQKDGPRKLRRSVDGAPDPISKENSDAQPITRHSVEWRVQIHDPSGREATVWKTTALTANETNITTIVDRNFVSTGKLVFVSASLGEISGPIDEGGTLSVTTVLREPLPQGQQVANTLLIRAINTYTESKETFGHIFTDRCGNAKILVELPAGRPAISASALRVADGTTKTLRNNVLSSDKRRIELVVKDAPTGAKYLLEWRW